jgi:hypothetical protein
MEPSMGAAGGTDPLGPVEDELVATGRFNRVPVAAVLGGLLLVGQSLNIGGVQGDADADLKDLAGLANCGAFTSSTCR